MKRAWVILSALAMVFGCSAHLGKTAQDVKMPVADSVYPYIAPNDPYIVAALDELLAIGLSEGYKILGMAADIEDDTMVWMEAPSGECVCIFLVFTQNNFIPFNSCEEGLAAWKVCVNAGECRASGEPKIDKSRGVWF